MCVVKGGVLGGELRDASLRRKRRFSILYGSTISDSLLLRNHVWLCGLCCVSHVLRRYIVHATLMLVSICELDELRLTH